MLEHKNRARAPLRPLDAPTLGLSVGGLGFLRPAPGTWGSMPPVAVLGAMQLAGATDIAMIVVTLVLLAASSAACVIWGGYAERRFGRKDAAEVVADETAGVCAPLLGALWAVSGERDRLVAFVAAFLLFRFFDIVKPPPARRLESLPLGWGVLVDDLVAGVYAMLAVVGLSLLQTIGS